MAKRCIMLLELFQNIDAASWRNFTSVLCYVFCFSCIQKMNMSNILHFKSNASSLLLLYFFFTPFLTRIFSVLISKQLPNTRTAVFNTTFLPKWRPEEVMFNTLMWVIGGNYLAPLCTVCFDAFHAAIWQIWSTTANKS